MPNFKDLNSLFKHIETQIQDTMTDEVAETVKENMAETIQANVYNAYMPQYYNRRFEDGGLLDQNNMEVTEIPDGISVRDVAPLDNKRTDYALDEIVVEGMGYMPWARDFYFDTADKLSANQEHVTALKQGLKRRGYDVE